LVKRNTTQQMRMRATIARSKPACHICGQAIDYSLPYSDPKCFVIDHVIPLAKGGEDALSNVRAAHRQQVTATQPSEHETTHP
jgi:5-methylcytosine-specific restriction endonuclease McrA